MEITESYGIPMVITKSYGIPMVITKSYGNPMEITKSYGNHIWHQVETTWNHWISGWHGIREHFACSRWQFHILNEVVLSPLSNSKYHLRSSVFFCWTWNMFETTRLNMFDYTWWVISTLQKNMKVSWDDDISIHSQYMENKSHVPNHQLDTTWLRKKTTFMSKVFGDTQKIKCGMMQVAPWRWQQSANKCGCVIFSMETHGHVLEVFIHNFCTNPNIIPQDGSNKK